MPIAIPQTVGLSDDQIDAAEQALGCTLPASFRAFLRDHDGARPEDNSFDVPGNQSCVQAFVPIAAAAELRREMDGFPRTGVPIAEDGCGNYVWLKPETGEILFWDHEIDGEGVTIGDDFDIFVAALQPFDPSSVMLQPGQVKHVWVDPDFEPEFD